MEFKGKFLFIDIAKVKPKVTNQKKYVLNLQINLNHSSFANKIVRIYWNHPSEEKYLHVDFKRKVRNSQQNSKYISKRKPLVKVNAHPENQTFSKVPVIPGLINFIVSDTLTKKQRRKIY